jgi:hypothetical protein
VARTKKVRVKGAERSGKVSRVKSESLGKARRLGPYSKPAVIARVDGRTLEGRLLTDTKADLIEHLGGSPNTIQRMLVDRAAWLTLRVALLDAEMNNGHDLTDCDHRHYIAWQNALRRTLVALGIDQAAPPPVPVAPMPTLAELIAASKE